MAHQLRYLAAIFMFYAGVSLTAYAQSPKPSEPKHRFTVFSTEQLTGISYVVSSKPSIKTAPLTFFPSSRSGIYEYTGAMPLQFMDTQTKLPVASVDIPKDVEDALLIFLPQPSATGERFTVYLHDDSKTKHGAGGLAVLNFSGLSIFGKIDRQNVQLKEGYQGPYEVGSTFKVQLSTQFRSRTLQTYADTISIGKDGRGLLILLPPFRKGSLEVQTRVLLDELPPKDPQSNQKK